MFFDASGLFGAHPVVALLDGDRDELSWGKQRKFPDGWAFELMTLTADCTTLALHCRVFRIECAADGR